FTNTRKISPGQWYQYFKQRIKIPRIEEVKVPLPVTQRIPNWFKQLKTFVTRDLLSKLANKQYMVINLSLSPVLALFMAFFTKYYDATGPENKGYVFFENENIPVYFFMSVVVALFVGLIVSAEEIFRDRKIRKREAFLHLSNSSYLFSKLVILFGLSAIQTFTFLVLGNLILEIPLTEIRYWLILFSCSCFANVLGLNISSAFDSAVTIYILIPVLVIPQLLMSGVVIPFDKFNPKVGDPVTIPVMGELMASRWAYEAFMVTQFKDNPYEKIFYGLDQEEQAAEGKHMWWYSHMETELSNLIRWKSHWRDQNHEGVTKALEIVRSELKYETESIDRPRPELMARLEVGKFDSTTFLETRQLLRRFAEMYRKIDSTAEARKEALRLKLTSTPENSARLDEMKWRYTNRAIKDLVEARLVIHKVVPYGGRLHLKYKPIYFDDHRPSNFLDFRANFYVPTKHFMGQKFDTLYFNVSAIWFMTIILFITLYFDLLKKGVQALETRRKYRRKNIT
ncbi:MAG: ABC transporter permease, partial [Cyclobacteriaceae bacterium]|nr:ABC transporter permease [Cyclobacteriaceae bacterium]